MTADETAENQSYAAEFVRHTSNYDVLVSECVSLNTLRPKC